MNEILKQTIKQALKSNNKAEIRKIDVEDKDTKSAILELLFEKDYSLIVALCLFIDKKRLYFTIDTMIDVCEKDMGGDIENDDIGQIIQTTISNFGEYSLNKLIIHYMKSNNKQVKINIIQILGNYITRLRTDFQYYKDDLTRLFEPDRNDKVLDKHIDKFVNYLD